MERGFCHYLLPCSFSGFIFWALFWYVLLAFCTFIGQTLLVKESVHKRNGKTFLFSRINPCQCNGTLSTKNPIHELICVEKWLESLNACTTNSYTHTFCSLGFAFKLLKFAKRFITAIVFFSSPLCSSVASHISCYNLCFLAIEHNLLFLFDSL